MTTTMYQVESDPLVQAAREVGADPYSVMLFSPADERDAVNACRVGVDWGLDGAELPVDPIVVGEDSDWLTIYPSFCHGERAPGIPCNTPDPYLPAGASPGFDGCYDVVTLRAFGADLGVINTGGGALFYGFEPLDCF